MYRKDKIAVAVDNYKSKDDDDDDDEEIVEENSEDSDDNETDDETIKSELHSDENEDPDAIKVVKAIGKVPNKDETNQVTGFNMFLNQLNPAKTDLSKSTTKNANNKNVSFQVLDPNQRYFPPSPYTVTSINQSHDLLRVSDGGVIVSATEQTSEEWLRNNGLESLKLTIEDLVAKGKLGDPRPDEETGEAVNCLIYDEMAVTDFEYRIHLAIELYSKRIKWNLQGSRKMFGHISGSRMGVLIDASDANLGFGRVLSLQDNLLHLLDEQLYKKHSLHLGYVGTNTHFIWEAPMELNCRVLEEAKESFAQLQQMGGFNLMQAVKQILSDKSLDHILLIVGSNPDQDQSLFIDFFQQLMLGRQLPFHCVAYESKNEEVNQMLRKIADITGGTFHRYSSVTEELVYTSNDIDLLLQEIEKAQEVLSKINLMRRGLFTNQISPIVNQIAREIRNVPQSEFLPQPPTFNDPLEFETPKFQPSTSDEWIKNCGLKAKKLNLYSKDIIAARLSPNLYVKSPSTSHKESYKKTSISKVQEYEVPIVPLVTRPNRISHFVSVLPYAQEAEDIVEKEEDFAMETFTKSVLSPNSYENRAEYVPSIGKLVTSSVYEKAMIQVAWPDGSSRNVHADLAQLFEYQKLLGEQVKLMEHRINWLASGSRRLFGTIVEKKVVFILDLSISNLKYLVHIQHSLKILLQQQLITKDQFNLVGFNNSIVSFQPHMVPVNETTIKNAWTWIKELSCSGSRNFLGALKFVLENPMDASHDDLPEGIYLFTSGVPDQSTEPLLSYIEERLMGTNTRIHTVLFNVDDYDTSGSPIPSRYANITNTAEIMRMIAHQTKGRFHWFRESGIIESDDIRTLMSEIDLAVEYSRRVQEIIRDFKEKYPDSHYKRSVKSKIKKAAEACRRESSDNMIALPPPRPTSLTKARQKFIHVKKEEAVSKIPKTLAYRPPNQTITISPNVDPMKSVTNTRIIPHVTSAFYTENGNTKGVVYRDNNSSAHLSTVATKKCIGKTVIPNKEEWISSRDWMKKYSLLNMGLNLLRLVSGPDCRHEESFVMPIEKFAEAKYCNGLFPIVNVKGTRKHMQFTPTELRRYDVEARKALIRYMKRLEWMMIGSKRIFGVVTEPSVAILLDTSGSMTPHMPELVLHLKALIWEQLFKRKIRYNLISFNSQIQRFRERLVMPDEVNCHSAIGWSEHLTANGNTDTLKALLVTLEDPNIQGIYLLSDGKPDTSTEMVLHTVREEIIKQDSHVKIHTISFNCEDSTANHFMKELSRLTDGRYHKVCHEYDIRMFTQRVIDQCQSSQLNERSDYDSKLENAAEILSIDPTYPPLPQVDGDDIGRIMKEIQLTRVNLSKTNYFRQLYYEMHRLQEERKKQSEEAARSARFELARRI